VPSEGNAADIRRAAQLISESERPLVYAGGGIIAANASAELRQLVDSQYLPAVTTLMGLGALPADNPHYISMPGMHGSYAANMAMSGADLLIALGVRFDDRVTGKLAAFAPNAKIIHVDIDAAEVGKIRVATVPIVGDVKKVLQKLNKVLGEFPAKPRPAWTAQIETWKREHPYDTPRVSGEIKPQHLISEIDRLSAGEAIVTTDVGQHQMWSAQLIRFNEPRLWINSGGLGAMGFGLPAAIGAQFARPDKLVFAIVGDGGFQMSIPELATISSYGLPIKIIVMNNGHLGMVRQWQELFYQNRLSQVKLDCFPDAALLAAAYGFKGSSVTDPKDLAAALDAAIKEPGPYLLNVHVTSFENVYPMVPAGGAIYEMVLGPAKSPEAVTK
jgi:acetolactate synthase-1/2/3 large subunit